MSEWNRIAGVRVCERDIGKKFGRLTQIGADFGIRTGKDRKGQGRCRAPYAIFRCECGTISVVRKTCVRTGKTISCGCFVKEAARDCLNINRLKRTDLHGMTGTGAYRSWRRMLGRCFDQKNNEFHRYGGRGIIVCESWLDFRNFFADMGHRPDGCSIDRLDVNKNYEPGNCKWSTAKEQARNTRRNRVLTIRGKTMPVVCWSEVDGAASESAIRARVKKGWDHERAVFGFVKE